VSAVGWVGVALAALIMLGEAQARLGIASTVLRLPLPIGGFSWLPFILLLSTDASAALLRHEREHEAQREREGWARWTFRYVTSAEHLVRYEVAAYRHNARALLQGHSTYRVVQAVTSALYESRIYWFWPWIHRPPRADLRAAFRRTVDEIKASG